MRYIVHAHVIRLVREQLKLDIAVFRQMVGVSFAELHHITLVADKHFRVLSDEQAQAIDRVIGACVSFRIPNAKMTSHLGATMFDPARLRAVIDRTGIAIGTLSKMLGRSSAWIHKILRHGSLVPLSDENVLILDELCSSNESPTYDSTEAPQRGWPLARVERDPYRVNEAVHAYCVGSVSVSASTNLVPKWRKILHVLVRMTNCGVTSVAENDVIVETWRAYPKDFGLRGYESQFPETREIRSKLVSSPLSTRYISRTDDGMPTKWNVTTAAVALVTAPRARESRRYADVLSRSSVACEMGTPRRCNTTVPPSNHSGATQTTPKAKPILAAFLTNKRKTG